MYKTGYISQNNVKPDFIFIKVSYLDLNVM